MERCRCFCKQNLAFTVLKAFVGSLEKVDSVFCLVLAVVYSKISDRLLTGSRSQDDFS